MKNLEELVLNYDKLNPELSEAQSLLSQIEAWDGPWEEWMAALHITRNNSLAGEVIKRKLDGFDPLHHHIASKVK